MSEEEEEEEGGGRRRRIDVRPSRRSGRRIAPYAASAERRCPASGDSMDSRSSIVSDILFFLISRAGNAAGDCVFCCCGL
jgi:hypothetical protein